MNTSLFTIVINYYCSAFNIFTEFSAFKPCIFLLTLLLLESLPLSLDKVVFDADCQTTTARGGLSLGYLYNYYKGPTIYANLTYMCFDFSGNLV